MVKIFKILFFIVGRSNLHSRLVLGPWHHICKNIFIWGSHFRPCPENKIFKFFYLFGGGALNGTPKQKDFNRYGVRVLKSTYCVNLKVLRWKTKFLKFWPFWGRGLKWKRKTKIFQVICSQGPNINLLCKFEGPALKNKKIKILAICEGPADPKRRPWSTLYFIQF